ncbi:MAG: hypothetical protein M1829_004635 [Trizodia sp. TS-e1964]|nr:MAG: hypothetical protein M1829_004635 [Trizodia sp. TS-e1964]
MTDSDPPSPPFLAIPGVVNFRDVGGYPVSKTTNQPRSIRRNLIFRSAEPSNITPEGIEQLHSLGITTMYDLRSLHETQRASPLVPQTGVAPSAKVAVADIDGVQRVYTPVFINQDYSPEAVAQRYNNYAASNGPEGYKAAYRQILAQGAPAFRTILQHLLPPANTKTNPPPLPSPFLIHCTVGKDRTGVIVALVLSLCGVADEDIAREYALTEQGLAPCQDVLLTNFLSYLGSNAESQSQLPGQQLALNVDKSGAEKMLGAKAENMLAALDMIREDYGGAEAYLRAQCGFDAAELERLRDVLVVTA